jgi:catechol O-methyltransferase
VRAQDTAAGSVPEGFCDKISRDMRSAASRLVVPYASASRSLSDVTRPPAASADFNELRERSLLRYIITNSTEGRPDSVIEAMDTFWNTFFNGSGTDEWRLRGNALDEAIRTTAPRRTMELGTYCGYTAVRIGRLLPPGARLISVEIEPLFAAIASTVVEHAGLRDTVSVEIGSVEERLPAIHRKHGKEPLDALLLDHAVGEFLPDLRLLEQSGLIQKSTKVLCDWNLYPGSEQDEQAPRHSQEFMRYLETRKASSSGGKELRTVRHSLRNKEVFTVSSWAGVV